MAESSLKHKTAHGLLWSSLGNVSQQLLNLAFGIFLARMLSVADYGMVGMIAIFSLIANAIQESGLVSAIANRQSVTKADYNAVFWFSVSVSFCIYWILFFCAPLIARFYSEPRLVPLCRFVFAGFFIASFAVPQNAYCFKNMLVGTRMKASVSALAASGCIGVYMAAKGFGYWSLAVQTVAYIIINTSLLWAMSPWRPSLQISLRPVAEMLPYSAKLLITNIFNIIINNVFSVVLGKFYGERQVGFYNQANKWTGMGSGLIANIVYHVSQPVLAQVRDQAERQKAVFRKMLRFTAFVSFPSLLGLLTIAPEFITLAITDKWQESVGIMQMLCISGAFVPIQYLFTYLLMSQGRSTAYMWGTIALGIIQVASAVLLHPCGISVMVWAYVGISLTWVLVWRRLAGVRIGLSLLDFAGDVLPFLLAACAAMAAAWLLAGYAAGLWLRLGIKVAVAACAYIGILWLAGAQILRESAAFLLSKAKA